MRKLLSILVAAILVLPPGVSGAQGKDKPDDGAPSQFNEFTLQQLQDKMKRDHLSSVELTNFYIQRILKLDQAGPGVNAVIELNPDALALARQADRRRDDDKALSPLDGIPVLIKDNIGT